MTTLEYAMAKAAEHDLGFSPEDVAALHSDGDLCLMDVVGHDGGRVGFVAFAVHDTQGERVLFVNMIHIEGNNPGAMDDLLASVSKVASGLGCSRARIGAKRMGWKRRLAPHGFVEMPNYWMEKGI